MKVREMRQLIHDKDDNDEIEFAAEGVVYFIGANIYIPEWKTLYLGLEDKDMNEALIQYEHESSGEDDTELDNSTVEDREAFMEALARDEDRTEAKLGWDKEAVCGEVCSVPPAKKEVPVSDDTDVMS
jgi:hypothetical protein